MVDSTSTRLRHVALESLDPDLRGKSVQWLSDSTSFHEALRNLTALADDGFDAPTEACRNTDGNYQPGSDTEWMLSGVKGAPNVGKWSSVFLVCVVSLIPMAKAFANCESTPSYRIGKTFPSVNGDGIVLRVSLPIEDFSPDKLVCLASALKKKFGYRQIVIDFFGSYDAARNYAFHRPESLPKDDLWASKKHAEYYFNRGTGEEYLLLIPDGINSDEKSPINTRINLATGEKPSCRLRVEERCLLSFDHIYSTKEHGFGTVSVNAEIKKSGIVSVKNAIEEGHNSTKDSPLTQFVVRNFRSWRFEPADKNTTIRITFSIEQVETPLKHGINVEFALPDRVKIQIGPAAISETIREDRVSRDI